MLAQQRMERVGHIAGRKDVRVGGTQLRRPRCRCRPPARPRRERTIRRDPDPDDDHVGLDVTAVRRPTAGGPAPAAGDLQRLHTAAQVDPVVLVQVGEDLRNLATEHPQQRQVGHLQHGDLSAGRAGGGGGLQPDPAGADHHDPGGRWKAALIRSLSPGGAGRGRHRGQRPVQKAAAARIRWPAAAWRTYLPPSARPTSCAARSMAVTVSRGAGPRRARRTSPADGRRPSPARPCRAGSPSTAAGAHTAARSPCRSGQPGRRNPPSRSVSAALAPARLAPTMTCVLSVVMLSSSAAMLVVRERWRARLAGPD